MNPNQYVYKMTTKDNILSGTYEGYYWLNNATAPEVLEASPFPTELGKLDATVNPFIIEAQLFDKENKKSISVKYVDGTYILNEYDLAEKESADQSDGDGCCFTLKEYFANRMNGKKLIFRQYWKPVEDPLCEGMSVLQPSEMVFVGFQPVKTQPIKTKKEDEG